MTEPTMASKALLAVTPGAALDRLRNLATTTRKVAEEIDSAVATCRETGWSWASIGEALGLSRHSAKDLSRRYRAKGIS